MVMSLVFLAIAAFCLWASLDSSDTAANRTRDRTMIRFYAFLSGVVFMCAFFNALVALKLIRFL